MVGKACYKATGHIVFLAWKQRELAIGTQLYLYFLYAWYIVWCCIHLGWFYLLQLHFSINTHVDTLTHVFSGRF